MRYDQKCGDCHCLVPSSGKAGIIQAGTHGASSSILLTDLASQDCCLLPKTTMKTKYFEYIQDVEVAMRMKLKTRMEKDF